MFDKQGKSLFDELIEMTAAGLDSESDNNKIRDKYIEEVFEFGGKKFVERVNKYGYTEKGDKVVLDDWFKEYLELIGDYRIPHTLTTGAAQCGKAQPVYSKVLTPSGWTTIGELRPGDDVMSAAGTPCKVINIYPQGIKKVFSIKFDDGTSTECCEEHLWLTQNQKERRRYREQSFRLQEKPFCSVKTLAEIKQTLKFKNPEKKTGQTHANNHCIPLTKEIQFDCQAIPLDPYLLGAMLGDGSMAHPQRISFTNMDLEIIDLVRQKLPAGCILKKQVNGEFRRDGKRAVEYRINQSKTLVHAFESLNLLGTRSKTKFIPDCYKYNLPEIRLEVLRGLMDTDGSICNVNNMPTISTTSRQMADDIREIALSLGGLAIVHTMTAPSRQNENWNTAYSVRLTLPNGINPFRLTRKAERVKERNYWRFKRFVVGIEEAGEQECACILIDHPSHLYVTNDYIVTHNTLGHNLLLADTIINGKLNCGYFFSSRDSREVNTPEQQRPTIERFAEEYEKINGVKIRQRSDRKLSSRYQIDGVTAIFSYLSTSKASDSKSSLAAAGGSAVSFTAHVMFVEEAGQSPPESTEVVMPRLSASKIPTKPRRDLGTPGGGGASIEVLLQDVHRNFYPHAQCKHCRKIFPLHPLGCLLKPIKRKNDLGKEVTSYFLSSGRPALWFSHDAERPVETAYIGCPHCEKPIDNETRYAARYRCTKTGVWLRDFLDSLPVNDPVACADLNTRVGIHISPLVRKTKQNLAADLIDKGLRASRTADYHQQQLGIASSTQIVGISLEMLRKALAAPKPDGSPLFTLAGLDMGRSRDFLTIAQIYLPENYRFLDQQEISKQSIRRIVFSSDVERSQIPELLKRHKVNYGICDNEPSRDSSMELCNETKVLQMADQKDTLKDAVKLDKVKDGGAEYPCWFIRNKKFQDLILETFLEVAEDGYPLYRLPEAWNKHLSSKSDLSPFKHLTSPTRDPETEKWKRAADGNDDLFYSFLFLEAAFYIKCLELGKYPEWIGKV
jgi:hypothetical protein